jgi:hypothetical protein
MGRYGVHRVLRERRVDAGSRKYRSYREFQCSSPVSIMNKSKIWDVTSTHTSKNVAANKSDRNFQMT